MNKKACRRNSLLGHNTKHFKRVYVRNRMRYCSFRRGNIIWHY
jgi:hypothetical protein